MSSLGDNILQPCYIVNNLQSQTVSKTAGFLSQYILIKYNTTNWTTCTHIPPPHTHTHTHSTPTPQFNTGKIRFQILGIF